MAPHPQLAPDEQMTIEEFLAFTASRPDEERWELIEGVPRLNASPVEQHQLVVMNLVGWLRAEKLRKVASWLPLIGVGTVVPASPNSLPQPDAFVKSGSATGRPVTEDALVLFEVLSRSNTKADQAWRRRVYASVPNCQHYVTVSLKAVDVTSFDRSTGWQPRRLRALGDSLDLPALGVSMPLTDVYRWTELAGGE